MSGQKTTEEMAERLRYFATRTRRLKQPTSSSSIERETHQLTEDVSTSRAFRFVDLPPELAVKVLKNLGGFEIARFQTLSKACHGLVRDSLELQYIIELSVCNVVEAPHAASHSTRERLDYLRQWRRAWDNAEFGDPTTREGGPMLRLREINGSTFLYYPDGSTLEFHRMGSRWHGTHATRWTLQDMPPCREVAFKANEDLLVILEDQTNWTTLAIHLLTCSTGKPHPRACNDRFMIDSRIVEPTDSVSFNLAVCGDLVSIRASHSRMPPECSGHLEFWVFNWKTGDTLLNIEGELTSYQIDIHFFDHHHIILTRVDGSCQNLFVYDCRAFPAGRRSIVESRDYASVILRLPDLAIGRSYDSAGASVHIRPSEPIRFHNDGSDTAWFSRPYKPPIVCVSIGVGPRDKFRQFQLLIPASTILARTTNHARQSGMLPMPVPWREWGEETRMLEKPSGMHWKHGIHGSCYALASECLPELGYQDRLCIALYDFGTIPSMLRDLTSSDDIGTDHSRLAVFPWSEDTSGDVWGEDVITSAPCRVTLTNIVHRTSRDWETENETEWMIPIDGGIVMQKLDRSHEREELRAYTI